MERQTKSILEMAKGAFLERVDYEMERVVKNIRDPNTRATANRKITLSLLLAPDEERRNVAVRVEVKSSLAPTNPVVTNLYVAGESTEGVPQIIESTPQVPGQLDMFGNIQEPAPMLRIVGADTPVISHLN